MVKPGLRNVLRLMILCGLVSLVGCASKEPATYYVHFSGDRQMERHLEAAQDELLDLEVELAQASLEKATARLQYLAMAGYSKRATATYQQRIVGIQSALQKARQQDIPARVEFAVGYDPEIMDSPRDGLKLGDLRQRLGKAPYNRRVEVNHLVLYYTQGPGRKQYEIYLKRLARYRNHIFRVLLSHGLPPELICVAMIESAGDPTRVSHAGAAGMWQFIAATARKYRLVVNDTVDQRFDPVLQTYAAARYYQDLLKMFGNDVEAALAGYNWGEGNVEALLADPRVRSMWHVPYHGKEDNPDLPSMPRETYDYLSRWYAVAIVFQNMEKYDFSWPASSEDPFMLVHVTGSVDCQRFAQDLAVPAETLFALNPSFKSGRTSEGESIAVRLPPAEPAVYANRLREARQYRITFVFRHKVTAYQTLRTVATAYGVSAMRIADVNDLGEENRLEPGTIIKIPTSAGNEKARVAAVQNVRTWRSLKGTLWEIKTR